MAWSAKGLKEIRKEKHAKGSTARAGSQPGESTILLKKPLSLDQLKAKFSGRGYSFEKFRRELRLQSSDGRPLVFFSDLPLVKMARIPTNADKRKARELLEELLS